MKIAQVLQLASAMRTEPVYAITQTPQGMVLRRVVQVGTEAPPPGCSVLFSRSWAILQDGWQWDLAKKEPADFCTLEVLK